MKHPEHPWPANLYFLLSCVYIYRLLCCRRRQVQGLGSTTFPTFSFSLRKRLATGCIPPCIVVLAFIAVRKSCCVMVSRTLVERCGRASPSSLGCKRKLYTHDSNSRASRAYGTAQPDPSYPQLFELLSETDRGPRLQTALQVLPIFERCAEWCNSLCSRCRSGRGWDLG